MPPGDSHPISDAEAGARLDKWLADPARLGSRSKAADALRRGKVFVDDVEQTVGEGGRILAAGETVRIWLDRPGTGRRPARPAEGRTHGPLSPVALGDLRVVLEDDDLIVVDKPAGLLTIPREGAPHDDTVVARLERAIDHGGRRKVRVVHRIDRFTSGLVMVARNAIAEERLRDQFKRRQPERHYLAVVVGGPVEDSGTWTDDLVADRKIRVQRRARPGEAGREAISHFRVVERFDGATLLAVELETGKRNQIRVQASLRGYPLVGERLYTSPESPRASAKPAIEFERQALHATRLVFEHPRDRRRVELASPLPPAMERLLARLRRGTAR